MFRRDVVCRCLATCVDSCRYVEHLLDVLSPRRVAINYMCTGRWRVFSVFVTIPGNVFKLTLVYQSKKVCSYRAQYPVRLTAQSALYCIHHPPCQTLSFPWLLWERLFTHISITVYSQVFILQLSELGHSEEKTIAEVSKRQQMGSLYHNSLD